MTQKGAAKRWKRKRPRGIRPTPRDDRLLRARHLHPRLWGHWLLLGLLRLSVLLPQRGREAVGAGIGALFWWFAQKSRRIVLRNLELCFPELDEAQRRALARRNFRSMGTGLIEMAMAWWLPGERLLGLCEISGREHLEAARRSGRGVLLLTCHMAGLELSGAMICQLAPFKALYRDDRNPLIATVMRRARRRRIEDVIANHDMRGLMRALNAGDLVWFAPDQDVKPRRGGVFAPFFGIQAATTSATARLAQRTGCLVLPYIPQRLADGRYRIVFEPPLEDFPGTDPQAATARINAIVERWVREQPEHYFWAYKRFKTRPPGEPAVY